MSLQRKLRNVKEIGTGVAPINFEQDNKIMLIRELCVDFFLIEFDSDRTVLGPLRKRSRILGSFQRYPLRAMASPREPS